ncbi:SLAP domain-containing protein [Lactobacillus apis]|uniref:SLAP domain-containing protein n=1 Tax=Lactobacillus apis TaxID=303541 RepID=UPI00242E1523|nr:SLAP domain-containing protein [Lactobacillus apis]
MKLKKRVALNAIASVLALGTFAIVSQTNEVFAATTATNTMKLVHGAYVYNKNGKRLKRFQGSRSKTHLYKGATVKFANKLESIEPNTKQYFLLDDDNYHQTWLPYTKTGKSYYYNIGSGGYINAANVGQINQKPLYTAEATVKVKTPNSFPVGRGKDNMMIKNNQKIKVDRTTLKQEDPSAVPSYRISGTKTGFLAKSVVVTPPRQKLLTFSGYTYVLVNASINTFNNKGEVRENQQPPFEAYRPFGKGDKLPVDELLYIWLPKENKAELFYHLLGDSGMGDIVYVDNSKDDLSYLKADDCKYIGGPFLTPVNTPEQAKADTQLATSTDKSDLQKLIDQENVVKNSESYKEFKHDGYDAALATAKKLVASDTATVMEVKQAAFVLKGQQEKELKSPEELSLIDYVTDTKPY